MPILENNLIRVSTDGRYPRVLTLARKPARRVMNANAPDAAFTIAIDGVPYTGPAVSSTIASQKPDAVEYRVTVLAVNVTVRVRLALAGEELVFAVTEVHDSAETRVGQIGFPRVWLVVGEARRGDAYLRHVTRRTNAGRHWCPGTATYDQWEDLGPVAGAHAELGPQYANHACVWNEADGVCVGVACSIRVEPLVTELAPDGATIPGRAAEFRIGMGTWSCRLRDKPAEPLECRVAILADHNGDGRVDWADAAGWEGDRWYPPGKGSPLYHEAIVYKLFLDDPKREKPVATYADCLHVIERLHRISGGLRQIVYLVGWQGTGHDTAYPSHTILNPRVGTREHLVKLIDDARGLNCTVSLHANWDDSLPSSPEHDPALLSRDALGEKVWFHNRLLDEPTYSISHTLANESGYNADRAMRLLELLPIRETIHFDAHRPYNTVETAANTVTAECEVQRGLKVIKKGWADRGIDITTEDTDDEKRGLYSWVWIGANWLHPYNVVMYHGRLPGLWRAGASRGDGQTRIEAIGLGIPMTQLERADQSDADVLANFYLHWMYSQLLLRKRMTGYRVGDWNTGVVATYADDTRVVAGPGATLETTYEGIPIARSTDRFLPWRPDVIHAFSLTGGPQVWTLPEGWTENVTADVPVTVDGRTVRFDAIAGQPVVLRKA